MTLFFGVHFWMKSAVIPSHASLLLHKFFLCLSLLLTDEFIIVIADCWQIVSFLGILLNTKIVLLLLCILRINDTQKK